jgi:hypothetical protein
MFIKQKAFSLLGRQYNLFNFNCEHLATFSHTGKAESPQLQGAAFFVLLLVGLFALSRD